MATNSYFYHFIFNIVYVNLMGQIRIPLY